MKRIPALALVVVSLALVLRGAPAGAQGSGRSMDLDVSIRSAGMGGASNAVLWGGGLNHWANPAVLGAERGVRWEWGRTQLVPDLASDVIFQSHVLKLAGGGHGVVLSGVPFGPGVRLDYGVSEGVDENGNPTGTFEAFEQIDSWGFGVSLFETLERMAKPSRHARGPISRYLDVAFGMNFKEIEVDLAPFPGARSKTKARDWGTTVRVTPLDIETENGTPIHMEAAFGMSVLSYNDDAQLGFLGSRYPVSRHRRSGVALHFSADPAAGRTEDRWEQTWFEQGFSPLLSLGIAADRDEIGAGADEFNTYRTNGSGVELALANVLFGRAGQYEDLDGDIDGTTYGWGVQLPLGRFAGIRYDGAQFPQATGLKDVVRHGASAWIDVLEMHHAMRGRGRATL